jgi:putative transposase
MICETVDELTPVIGTRPACRALGAAPATIYRRRNPQTPRPPKPRPRPARALSDAERAAVLAELCSQRFADSAPAQVYATLLDEGRYLASERTMYRILAAEHGHVRERRAQLAHPPYQAPELLAERPNEVWSWDITKLKGPAKWTYYYLYVILDVFSRFAVGWTVQQRETGPIAKALITQAAEQQRVSRDQLIVHADRGSSMTSKPVAFLLADLGITRSHSRPYTSTDNPYSEAQFKTLKYRPAFPARFEQHRARPRLLPRVLRPLQPSPPALRDRPDDAGDCPLRPRRRRPRRAPARARLRLCQDTRAVRPARPHATDRADRRMDQQAHVDRGGRSLNIDAKRLTGLDRLRQSVEPERLERPHALGPEIAREHDGREGDQ